MNWQCECLILPQTNHLVECRNEINETFDVKRNPGMIPGSYLSLQNEVVDLILAQKKYTNLKSSLGTIV